MIVDSLEYLNSLAEHEAFKIRLKEIGNKQSNNNLQNIHTPFPLVKDILSKLDEVSKLDGTILTFNLEFVEWLIYFYEIDPTRITYFTDCLAKGVFVDKTPRYAGVNIIVDSFDRLLIDNYIEPVPIPTPTGVRKFPQPKLLAVKLPPNTFIKPRLAPVKVAPKPIVAPVTYKFNKLNKNMKFDVIVGNPPYQTSPVNGKTHPLWHKFVDKSFDLVKDGGYVCMVHPSGWRNVDGKFKKTQELMASKQMEYLEMHSIKDGQQTFGVSTRYDWYVIKNVENKHEKTLVKFQDGIEESIDLNNIAFIPNGMVNEIDKLIAKDGEERVNLLYASTAYHTQKDYMSKYEDGEYKYPCVANVSIKNEPSCIWYSNTNENGMFGLPKVIFGGMGAGAFIDEGGDYGMEQHCAGIVDDVENLENIALAMRSPKFIEMMSFTDVGGINDLFNRKVIALFRKDFWKDFI